MTFIFIVINFDATYSNFFLGNFVIKRYRFLCHFNQKKSSNRINKKIIGYNLNNKSCPLPING
jgi:hypothetical protein